MDALVRAIEKNYMRDDLPTFRPGDTVKVYAKVIEGGRERIQAYEGIVLQIRGAGMGKTFTVRRIGADGIGVERVFPMHSPVIDKVEVTRKGKVRRAKIYYIRKIRGKIKIKQRRD
ncbi:50S ribosomal protein L19 [Tepiditoga spiralis]|uniref:Large ribosomal subunit protein bL19 n=1 Tax=Tepiditoga spiralis TaxID=2108365 RepID=A0A7G1G2R9_9BACT|nr:50S ribosomal protein L19 [Tepiditoga spiralis]BBE30680.1 50S ribosomal protein L19 [Tepiditoga spiralis]